MEGASDGRETCRASWYEGVTAGEPGRPHLLTQPEFSLKRNAASREVRVLGSSGSDVNLGVFGVRAFVWPVSRRQSQVRAGWALCTSHS